MIYRRLIFHLLAVLALWLPPTAQFVYAADPDPEAPVCPRDGSARSACRLAWVEQAQTSRIQRTLGRRRIVAFYGSPLGPGLGVLGNSPPETMLARLRAQADAYQKLDPRTEAIPAFHMVTTVADGHSGRDEDYSHRLSREVIQQWIDWAAAENVWIVLDIQPGRADLLTEFDLIEPFLHQPHVQLAVDPEFVMDGDGIPGKHLGRIDAATINAIQSRLDAIARSIGTTKVLIVHQFDDRMIADKDTIENYWRVEMVWDADGFGSPGSKVFDYKQYRSEAGFEKGGIKLFYREDEPLMTPEEVMALDPKPSIIIYQ